MRHITRSFGRSVHYIRIADDFLDLGVITIRSYRVRLPNKEHRT
jgi:hypothetical protein